MLENGDEGYLLEKTRLSPRRYLWENGKPIFDILKVLLEKRKGGNMEPRATEFLQDLKRNFQKSGFNDVKARRDNLDVKIATINTQIESWSNQVENLMLIHEEQDARKLILSGQFPTFTANPSVSGEVGQLSAWVETAKGVLSELERDRETLTRELSSALIVAAFALSENVQNEINLLVGELEDIFTGFCDSVYSAANGNGVPLKGLLNTRNCGLNIYSDRIPAPITNRGR